MNIFSYYLSLRKLQKSRNRAIDAYKKDYSKATKEKSSQDELDRIRSSEQFEVEMIDDEIETLVSRYVVEKANRMVLPLPELERESSEWERSKFTERYRLSRIGVLNLKATIRKELRERREGWAFWLVGLTGAIGAITGLIAVLKS